MTLWYRPCCSICERTVEAFATSFTKAAKLEGCIVSGSRTWVTGSTLAWCLMIISFLGLLCPETGWSRYRIGKRPDHGPVPLMDYAWNSCSYAAAATRSAAAGDLPKAMLQYRMAYGTALDELAASGRTKDGVSPAEYRQRFDEITTIAIQESQRLARIAEVTPDLATIERVGRWRDEALTLESAAAIEITRMMLVDAQQAAKSSDSANALRLMETARRRAGNDPESPVYEEVQSMQREVVARLAQSYPPPPPVNVPPSENNDPVQTFGDSPASRTDPSTEDVRRQQ